MYPLIQNSRKEDFYELWEEGGKSLGLLSTHHSNATQNTACFPKSVSSEPSDQKHLLCATYQLPAKADIIEATTSKNKQNPKEKKKKQWKGIQMRATHKA